MRPGPYERHRELLQSVVRALAAGECRRPFTEATGRNAADAGMRSTRTAGKVFRSLLGRPFELGQPGELGRVRTESSPYGLAPPIDYPRCDPAELVAAAGRAARTWWWKSRQASCLAKARPPASDISMRDTTSAADRHPKCR